MKLYFWNGQSTNLGRFGKVQRGDPLALTNNEAAYVEKKQDRNFRPAKPGQKFPENAPGHLRKQADPDLIDLLELGEASYDQLVARCEVLKASGAVISFSNRSSRDQLIAAIRFTTKKQAAPVPKPVMA